MRGFFLRVFIAFFCVHQRIVIDHAHAPEQGSDRLLLPWLRVSAVTITFDTHTSIIYLVSRKIIPIWGAPLNVIAEHVKAQDRTST